MKSLKIIAIIYLLLYPLIDIYSQVDGNLDRKMAVYLTGEGIDDNFQANFVSVKQIIAVSGLPANITSDFNECLDYGVILFGNIVYENALTSNQVEDLINYVSNGGCIIFPGLTDPNLFELAGINESKVNSNRRFFSFKSSISDPELRWIDESYEREIKLGGYQYASIFPTVGYKVTSAEVFALYRGANQAAIIKHKYGDGLVYSFGVEWRDVIIRNLLDRDYQANRIYSNAFEASSDVFMLMIRGIFARAVQNSIWLSPAPYDSKAVFIITHDVCSHTAHIFSNDFAQMEFDRGIVATFNITTHQFIDDINGDNYSSHIPQMKLLIHKGHDIGSHSYGHFPDFASEEIFPVGEPLKSVTAYSPSFSIEEGRTIGGTVYGELGVSKQLLENDLNITVKAHRSGHLVVNPAQYDVLDELNYKYSSSYTSPDVLTAFPFFTHAGRAMNGRQLPLVEIPLTISDVFGNHGAPIDEFNWVDKAILWLDILERYANNNSMTTLLVHPNRKYKLDAMNYVLDNMSDDIYPMGLANYAEFWKAKMNVKFSSKLEGNVLKIYANDTFFSDEAFSFVYDYPNGIESIELYNDNNELQDILQRDYYVGTAKIYQKGISDLKDAVAKEIVNPNEIMHQNYPNPFSYYTTIAYEVPERANVSLKVLDMYGRVVDELVNENQAAGIYELGYSSKKLSVGIYFYQINMRTDQNYFTATRKMMVR